jgi:heterodisulfide reductase subunit C
MASIFFIILSIIAFGFAFKSFNKISRNIHLGKDEAVTGDTSLRWKNVLLIAFGQKKMFKKWIPAVLHLFIYVAFLFTQVELIEILIDGIFGTHRFFAPYIGVLYSFIMSFIEILSFLALVATVAFLMRRNVLKVERFQKSEMKGWPIKDANIILLLEIVLIFAIFMMNGSDKVLQSINPEHYPNVSFAISNSFGPQVFSGFSESTLHLFERAGWWLHYIVVLTFLNYLPLSKHLHILLAFPNTFYSKLVTKGKLENMPEITREVKSMMDLPTDGYPAPDPNIELSFGANDVTSLSWKNVMDAFTCTECGRCTDACPANITGKKLSPRKIMMDVRDRATEIGDKLDSKNKEWIKADQRETEGILLSKLNFDDGKSLFNYIEPEEIHACTTCNACVEACPVLINPLDIIVQLRRYEILTASAGPSDWIPMFTSIENSGSVWQMPVDRDAWAQNV